MTAAEQANVRAFIATAPWERTPRGQVAVVWLRDEMISPECMPRGVVVVDVGWARRAPNGLVPVRIRKRGGGYV